MKVGELRELRDNELCERLTELEQQLFTLRSQSVTEKIADVHAVRNVRKDIARVKTLLREREIEVE